MKSFVFNRPAYLVYSQVGGHRVCIYVYSVQSRTHSCNNNVFVGRIINLVGHEQPAIIGVSKINTFFFLR